MRIDIQKKGPARDESASLQPAVSLNQVRLSAPLLQTKLFVPPLRPEIIPRSRLLSRFDADRPRALTLISAPAGYGKTTLMAEWLRDAEQPFAWLSLDEGDNDPVRFLTYFIAALNRIEGSIGEAAQSLLALPRLPPCESLMALLINDIAATPETFTLVLDDYHTIHTPFIHASVEFLVQHAPPQLRLVLITREDPPFSLSRLRVRSQLTEIRGQDLRFTADEATEWLNARMGLNLGEKAVRALETRTEGWIAGLQLAALSLQGQDPERVADFIDAFGGSDRYVIDYLFDEVLRRQPDTIRSFLCQTAILGRLSAPLCDAVTGRTDSKTVLGQLEQANLFLVPLDNQREWYRYHRLFSDFLRVTELEMGDQVTLHARAAQWYESHGLHAEAIQHALAAGDMDHAARLIEQAANEALHKAELVTLLKWLDALPASTLDARIDLVIYKAWALYLSGSFKTAEALVAQLDAGRVSQASASTRGRLLALQARLARVHDDAQGCVQMSQEAIGLIGDADPFFRIMALLSLGEVESELGQNAAATPIFRQAFLTGRDLGHSIAALSPLLDLAANLNREGRRREAELLCRQAIAERVDARGRPLPSAGLVYVPLGMLCYEANELETSRDYVQRGLELYKQLGLETVAMGDGEWTLIRLQQATGEVQQALTTARDTRAAALASNQLRMAFVMDALEADTHLRMGDLESASRWGERAGLSPDEPPRPLYEVAYFTLGRLLLAQRHPEQAQALLANLERSAHQGGRNGRLITIFILRALSELAIGRPTEAVHFLERAIRIAAPEGYTRAFLDEDPVIATLLPHVRHLSPAFVDGLLMAFSKDEARKQKVEIDDSTTHPAPYRLPPLIEPLSERELEVLRLIAAGKSNAEIAQALVVVVSTAKWHVHNVLGKLGATSRTQAIARARELNLL